MLEGSPSSRPIQEPNSLKLKDGVHIETLWKAQRELASQQEIVNRLQQLEGRVAYAEKEMKLMKRPLESRLQDLKIGLAARLSDEQKKLDDNMKALYDLYEWPSQEKGKQNKSGFSNPTLVEDLERALQQ